MAIVKEDDSLGKICTNCGEWKPIAEFHKKVHSRDGLRSACKICTNADNKKRADGNRERERERLRAYYATHTEERRAYRLVNIERQRRSEREWREKNGERMREYSREYYRLRPEVAKNANRKWEAANRDKRQAIDRRRRARKQQAEGEFTNQEWQALMAYYNHTCLCCGKGEPEIQLTPDHVIPLAKGGSNAITNIQPLCRSCNCAKAAKITDYRPQSGNV